MDKNIKNAQIGFFLQYVTPKDFFQKSASVTFVSLWCPNFMQNKTSIQWTPGSQIYLSSKKIILGQKWFLNKNKKKYTMDPGIYFLMKTNKTLW